MRRLASGMPPWEVDAGGASSVAAARTAARSRPDVDGGWPSPREESRDWNDAPTRAAAVHRTPAPFLLSTKWEGPARAARETGASAPARWPTEATDAIGARKESGVDIVAVKTKSSAGSATSRMRRSEATIRGFEGLGEGERARAKKPKSKRNPRHVQSRYDLTNEPIWDTAAARTETRGTATTMFAALTIAPVAPAPLVTARRVARRRTAAIRITPSTGFSASPVGQGTFLRSVARVGATGLEEETRSPWTEPAPAPSSAWEPARSDWQPPWVRRLLLGAAATIAAVAYFAAISVHYNEALADVMDVNEPSIMKLELKPRTQEVILETKAEHINEDFSHEDLVGAIYTEGDLRGSDFRGSDLRAAIFSRAIMPGVNLEGADMSNSFLDYVVLRGSNMRGVIAREANFVRSDLGDCDVTNADFTEAVIDRYQAINLCDNASGTNPFTGVDTRDSLGCERLKRYEGFNKENSKVAVSKGSGTWGGAASGN